MATPKGSKYKIGQDVLCFHGSCIYDAKCLQIRLKADQNEYLVHYAGWNKTWDEWAPESRVLEVNPANLAKQQELEFFHNVPNQKKGKAGKSGRLSNIKDTKRADLSDIDPDSRPGTPCADSRSRTKADKRRRSATPPRDSAEGTQKTRHRRIKQESVVNSEAEKLKKNEVEIEMRGDLLTWLAEDKLYITQYKKQSILPATHTVEAVLDSYLDHRKQKETLDKFCSTAIIGIKDFFNGLLIRKLLFDTEHVQFEEFTKKNPDLRPSQYCGPNYLLRLFYRLGIALAHLPLNPRSKPILLEMFKDLFEYLASKGEKVLCYHGPLIYEAKCLNVRVNEDRTQYYVHYKGWNRSWDEWVPDNRMLRHNDENLVKQRELLLARKDSRKRSKSSSTKTPKTTNKDGKNVDVKSEGSVHDPDSRSSTPSVEGKSKFKECKAKSKGKDCSSDTESIHQDSKIDDPLKGECLEDDIEEVEFMKEEEIEIPVKIEKPDPVLRMSDLVFDKNIPLTKPENGGLVIPETLLVWLTEDHYQVNRLKRLTNLPSTITVCNLLADYQEFKLKDPNYTEVDVRQIVSNLDDYFCACLGAFLLFKCERPQYSDILETYPRCRVSTVYGPNHFLRLLGKTNSVLQWAPTAAIRKLLQYLHEVLDFLSINEKKYFSSSNYGIAPPEYQRRMM